MTAKLQHTDISLKEVVYNIEKGIYTIPKFQRDFVWNTTDISSLADSIIRGYPIASLLTLPYNGNLNVGSDPLKTTGSHINPDISKLIYILDGQQRITALSKIFLNYDDSKLYYFDLLAILKDNFPEDNIVQNNGKILKDTDLLCRTFSRGKNNEEPPSKYQYRYISGKSIINGEYSSIVSRFISTLNLEKDDYFDKYLNSLNSQLGIMSGYSIPITMISAEADLGLICRIFEKVNSSGIKLTTFDLINAKSFGNTKYNQLGIAHYITKDLLQNYKREDLLPAFYDFLEYDENTEQFLSLSRVSRIIYLSELFMDNKAIILTNHNMLSKTADYWFEMWDKNKENIIKFLKWISDERITKLAPSTFFEYMAAILITKPKIFETQCFMHFIKRKAISLGIMGRNFTKSDFSEYNEINQISNKIILLPEFQKYEVIPKINVDITEDFLSRRLMKGTIPYNCAIYIMGHEKIGKFNVDLLNFPIKYKNIDEHHIIPKSQSKGKDSIYNSIVNITLLNKDSNRNEVKGKPLSDYLKEIEITLNNQHLFNTVCEQNIIPLEYINDDELFLEARKELLTSYLNNYFK